MALLDRSNEECIATTQSSNSIDFVLILLIVSIRLQTTEPSSKWRDPDRSPKQKRSRKRMAIPTTKYSRQTAKRSIYSKTMQRIRMVCLKPERRNCLCKMEDIFDDEECSEYFYFYTSRSNTLFLQGLVREIELVYVPR